MLLELVCNLLALSFPAEFEILVVSCRASTSTNAMDGFVCQPKMFVVLAALLVGSYSVTCKAEGMDSFGRAPTLATENVTRPELSVQGTYSIGYNIAFVLFVITGPCTACSTSGTRIGPVGIV